MKILELHKEVYGIKKRQPRVNSVYRRHLKKTRGGPGMETKWREPRITVFHECAMMIRQLSPLVCNHFNSDGWRQVSRECQLVPSMTLEAGGITVNRVDGTLLSGACNCFT